MEEAYHTSIFEKQENKKTIPVIQNVRSWVRKKEIKNEIKHSEIACIYNIIQL